MTGSWPGTQPAIRPGWPVKPRAALRGRGVFGRIAVRSRPRDGSDGPV